MVGETLSVGVADAESVGESVGETESVGDGLAVASAAVVMTWVDDELSTWLKATAPPTPPAVSAAATTLSAFALARAVAER